MFKMGSFRSYVGLDEYEMKAPNPATSSFLQPHFLPGELIVAAAHSVLKFTSVSKKQGLSGSLFVTNARLVFVSSSASELSPSTSKSSACSEDSVPLLSIHTLCYHEGSTNHLSAKKTKRKVYLGPFSNSSLGNSLTSSITSSTLSASSSSPLSGNNSSVTNSNSHLLSASTRIHELYVICSNFRTLRVSFKFSPVDHGQKICNALIHWSFPQQVEKLFYLDYCRDLDKKQNGNHKTSGLIDSFYSPRSTTIASGFIASWIPSYTVPGDWLRELKITRSPGFRLTDSNVNYELCQSLPENFVVPAAMTDVRLISLAGKLRGNRPPFWVWGDANGAAILRMAKLYNEADSSAENAFYEMLRKGTSQRKRPRIYDLDNAVTIKDLRQSLTKVSELCCPESFSQHEEHDSKFYSLVENTKWMLWISRIMHLAREIADVMVSTNGIIILQENESRDTSCLLSSIIQVLIDSRFRTITGFFSLIQKEWVMTGHQFHSVYMHTSPVFLLFLDITHQLLIQNPFEFEFNEELLSDLWDSTFDSSTGTFLFDSPNQRRDLELRKDITAWFRILTKEEVDDGEIGPPLSSSSIPVIPKCLCNPMFKLKSLLYPPSVDKFTFTPTAVSLPLIQSSWSMSDLEFWGSLFLNRSLGNQTSLPSSVTISSPALLPYAKNYGATVPQTPTSSSRTPIQSAVFLFSSSINNNVEISGGESTSSITGRDLMYEMKFVETLLNKLSISTSFRRSNHVRAAPPVPSSSLQQQQGTTGGSLKSGSILQRPSAQESLKPFTSQKPKVPCVPGYARPGIERPLPKPRITRPPVAAHNESGSVALRKNPFFSSVQEQDCE